MFNLEVSKLTYNRSIAYYDGTVTTLDLLRLHLYG